MIEGFRLDTTKPTEDFNRHLSIDGNNRIIFSGPFGSGKTSFLKEYFEEKEEYEVFHLFPVNYSVASNGDIFELIKFDLLFELLGKDVDLEKEDFSKHMTLQMFFLNNQFDVAKTFYDSIKPLFEGISKIGKDVTEIFNPISKLYEKWKKHHEEMQIDEKKEIIDYLQSFVKNSGSHHEDDIFTQIIRNLVSQIKSKGKKTILVIDDLDRIDPEHIFRILNIFAAHFDTNSHRYNNEENKFGFFQILLICDLNNIRNIFFNKYGQNVDFTGYIDKFYSKDVFNFDNIKVLEDKVSDILRSIEYCEISKNHVLYKRVTRILIELIINNVLNLRDVEKIFKTKYTFKYKEIVLKSGKTEQSFQFYELILIDFLRIFFGDIENLKSAILKTRKVTLKSTGRLGNIFDCFEILPLFTQDIHNFIAGDYVFQYIKNVQDYPFYLRESSMPSYYSYIYRMEYQSQNKVNLDFFEIFYDVIEMAQTENYIN